MSDLAEVIRALDGAFPDPAAPRQALEVLGLGAQQQTVDRENASERWIAAVRVVLEQDGDKLGQLLALAGNQSRKARRDLERAVVNVREEYVTRVLATEHTDLADQVDMLIEASNRGQMERAALALREVVLGLRQLLAELPAPDGLGRESGVELEVWGQRLAEEAVDVINVTDYLLHSLRAARPGGSAFAGETESSGAWSAEPGQSGKDQDTDDLKFRRVLDARAAAVRLAGRFLQNLRRGAEGVG